jgi:hypothetical protein
MSVCFVARPRRRVSRGVRCCEGSLCCFSTHCSMRASLWRDAADSAFAEVRMSDRFQWAGKYQLIRTVADAVSREPWCLMCWFFLAGVCVRCAVLSVNCCERASFLLFLVIALSFAYYTHPLAGRRLEDRRRTASSKIRQHTATPRHRSDGVVYRCATVCRLVGHCVVSLAVRRRVAALPVHSSLTASCQLAEDEEESVCGAEVADERRGCAAAAVCIEAD